MQEQGDRPVRPGRPSLISSETPAAPGQQGILSSLDGKAALNKSAPAPVAGKSGALVWSGVGIGLVAALAAIFFWPTGDIPEEPAALIAAAPAAAVAAPVVAAVAAVPVAANTGDAADSADSATPASPEPSKAAVLNDIPDASKAGGEQPAVADVLAAPPPKAAAKKDHLTEALEHKSRPADKKAERKAEVKKAAPKKAKEKPAEKAAPKQPDPDVQLIAALMSHIEPRRKATPAEQLKICKQYNAAGEEQCRARLCSTDAKKEPECKARAGKAAAGS